MSDVYRNKYRFDPDRFMIDDILDIVKAKKKSKKKKKDKKKRKD